MERVENPGSGSSPNPQMLEMKNGGKFSLIMNAQSRDDENDRMAETLR